MFSIVRGQLGPGPGTIFRLAGATAFLHFDDDDAVVLARLGDDIFALEDLCTHDGSDISGGCIVEGAIECPRHGARFCLRTGEVLSPPAYEGLHVFPVKIEDGDVWVKDDRWD